LSSLITSTFVGDALTDAEAVLTRFFAEVARLEKTRGIKEAVKYVKKARLIATRYISGTPLCKLDGIKIKDGWAARFIYLKSYTSSPEGIRWLLTLLTVFRDVILPPEVDLNPITDKFAGKRLRTSKSLHHNICRELGIRSRYTVKWSNYHWSTKKGPIGQALASSIYDFFALPPELYGYIALMGDSPLKSHMDACRDYLNNGYNLLDIWKVLYPHSRNQQLIRRLSYFGDKEGKTRVIAILDYWSQTALYPLHRALMGSLKKIRTDCTFNQDHFHKCLPQQGPYFSFDLSNATDRMPISLQERIVARFIGKERAKCWSKILVGYPFTVLMPDRTSKEVLYGCGQPMGAYSSWPAMALTHHYLVKYSALKIGITNFWDYALLGDDIVIANAGVAQSYQETLKYLDMPISQSKTHISNDIYEFAKRWVYKGTEVTPFSYGGFLSSWKRYPYLQNFLENQHRHAWSVSEDRHPGLITSMLTLMGKPSQASRTLKLYMVFKVLVETKQTGVFTGIIYNMISEYFGLPNLDLASRITLEEQSFRKVSIQNLERDVAGSQTEFGKCLAAQYQIMTNNLPGLDDRSYRQFARTHVPMIMAVNDRLDYGTELLCKLWSPDDFITDELWIAKELKKTFVDGRVFSQRAASGRLQATARLVKLLITEIKSSANAEVVRSKTNVSAYSE